MRFADVVVGRNLIRRRAKSTKNQRNDESRPIFSVRAVEENRVVLLNAYGLQTQADLLLVVVQDDLRARVEIE